jgi:hypothetical protein
VPDPVRAAVAALSGPLAPLDETVAGLAREPGLVAWWGPVPGVDAGAEVVLAVGAATMLRNRVTRQDLYRTGVSELRRVLAGLLLDELDLAPAWAAEVVLPRADEERLTAWMRAHLRLSWTARDDRREVLPGVVAKMAPALDPVREPGRSALQRYLDAAGPRPDRVVGGPPFQRP